MTSSDQPSLEILLEQLHAILESIPFLDSHAYRPPVIDGDSHNNNGPNADPIQGLRIFTDSIRREVEVLHQFLAESAHGSDLSTNAPYFIAVWNEILAAPPPIVAIGKVFDPPHGKRRNMATGPKPGGIKVDVVGDEGRKLIRVNTIKNSRILAEFREFDSYLTGSESDESDVSESFNPPTDQDNSLLRMGRALVAAGSVPVDGTNERPCVTLRLTRLNPEPSDGDTDPRIAQTISSLRSMGLDVELGERSFRSLHHDSVKTTFPFQPTRRINLDLSILIALVSDLSHAQLPHTEEEAWSRFRMPINARSWKLGKAKISKDVSLHDDSTKHSRALSTQCIQEMAHGLVEEVVERLDLVSLRNEQFSLEFWTSEEARDRCLQIADKIGGADERRRVSALFPSSPEPDVSFCRGAFWHGSRYPASYFPQFLPINIYTSTSRLASAHPDVPLFWGHLIQTCRRILSHDITAHPKLYRKDGEMERAKVAKGNTKLTVHTVESMLLGAYEGMTTLTANKASVKAILREMKAVRKGPDGALVVPTPTSLRNDRNEGNSEDNLNTAAAIWIVEPRSLAEGMRADRLQ